MSVKARLVLLIMTVCVGNALQVWAAQSNKAPSDFPDNARILSSVKHETRHWNLGVTTTWITEVRIGRVVYSTHGTCHDLRPSTDYPAKIEERELRLLVGNRECRFVIASKAER